MLQGWSMLSDCPIQWILVWISLFFSTLITAKFGHSNRTCFSIYSSEYLHVLPPVLMPYMPILTIVSLGAPKSSKSFGYKLLIRICLHHSWVCFCFQLWISLGYNVGSLAICCACRSTPLSSTGKGHYLLPFQAFPSLWRSLHSHSSHAGDPLKTEITLSD